MSAICKEAYFEGSHIPLIAATVTVAFAQVPCSSLTTSLRESMNESQERAMTPWHKRGSKHWHESSCWASSFLPPFFYGNYISNILFLPRNPCKTLGTKMEVFILASYTWWLSLQLEQNSSFSAYSVSQHIALLYHSSIGVRERSEDCCFNPVHFQWMQGSSEHSRAEETYFVSYIIKTHSQQFYNCRDLILSESWTS